MNSDESNDSDLEHIKEAPVFSPQLPENATFASKGDRWIAQQLSVVRQHQEWHARILIVTHNRSADSAQWIREWRRKYESPIRLILFVLGILLTAFLGGLVEHSLDINHHPVELKTGEKR